MILTKKKFILNADDFGLSTAINKAVTEGMNTGLLKSVSLVANGVAYDDAVDKIIPQYPELGIGIHLNVTEGYSLCQDLTTLTDTNNRFINNYWQLLIKSYNKNEKDFFEDLEREFRRQIEKILSKTKVTHIDSHQHIHSIPKIFELVCRLAKEYNIKQIRTHFEKFYIVPEVHRHFNKIYPRNIIKTSLYGLFTIINESTLHKYELKTNDYLIGLLYNSLIDALAVSYGLMAIKYNNMVVETVVHPSRYEDGTIDDRFKEYLLIKNKKLIDKIKSLGYEITNYAEE